MYNLGANMYTSGVNKYKNFLYKKKLGIITGRKSMHIIIIKYVSKSQTKPITIFANLLHSTSSFCATLTFKLVWIKGKVSTSHRCYVWKQLIFPKLIIQSEHKLDRWTARVQGSGSRTRFYCCIVHTFLKGHVYTDASPQPIWGAALWPRPSVDQSF